MFDKKVSMLAQIHESECFVCNKSGSLQLCDLCPRAYHSECQELKLNSDQKFTCSADQHLRQCQFCSQMVQNDDEQLKCTICLRPAHDACYEYPSIIADLARNKTSKEEGQEMDQESIYNERSYVCRICFTRNGVRKFKRIERIVRTKNFIVQEFQIALVYINSKSPIHYGWFCESDIHKAVNKQRENPYYNNKRQSNLLDNRIVQIKPIIQKILTFRLPKTEFGKISELQGLQMLKDKDRIQKLAFGGKINFTFLVKWCKCQYSMATWEDEVTVRLLDNNNHLDNFIKRLSKQLAIPTIAEIDLTFIPRRKTSDYLSKCLESLKIMKMVNYKWIYGVSILVNDRSDLFIHSLIEYLKVLYLTEQQTAPTLVIVPKDKIKEWKEQLMIHGKELKYLIFSGNKRNIELIKSTEFINEPKSVDFQVLVIDPQGYKQHKLFLQTNITYFQDIILTNFMQPDFIQELISLKKNESGKKFKSRLTFVINRVFNNRLWEQDIIRKTCSFFENNIVKHTLSFSELQFISCKSAKGSYLQNGVNFNNPNKEILVKLHPLPQLQRRIFLNYVLKFGYIQTNIAALYDSVYSNTCDDLYGKLTPKGRGIFRNYVKSFFTILTVYQQMQIPEQTTNYYLFDIDPTMVLKRIIQLFRLRQVVQGQAYQFDIKPTSIQNDDGQIIGELGTWGNKQDLTLSKLITRFGYGKWQEIMKDRYYGHKKIQVKVQALPYSSYLKIFMKGCIKSPINEHSILKFVRMRSVAILQRMSDAL